MFRMMHVQVILLRVNLECNTVGSMLHCCLESKAGTASLPMYMLVNINADFE